MGMGSKIVASQAISKYRSKTYNYRKFDILEKSKSKFFYTLRSCISKSYKISSKINW